MKKRNLQLLTLGLFLLLAQNSLAHKVQEGNGSEAASEGTVAIGLDFTDVEGGTHKNIAGDPADPTQKRYATAIGIANTASGILSSAFGYISEVDKLKKDGSGNLVPDENYGKDSLVFGNQYQVTGERSGAFGTGQFNG